jgi:hypothetical protein
MHVFDVLDARTRNQTHSMHGCTPCGSCVLKIHYAAQVHAVLQLHPYALTLHEIQAACSYMFIYQHDTALQYMLARSDEYLVGFRPP